MNKHCPTCKTEKPLTNEFWAKCSSRKDGFHWRCKACVCSFAKKLSSKRSQKRREDKRYLVDSLKVKARTKARDYWGSARNYKCSVLSCHLRAEHLHHLDYELSLDVVPYCKKHHNLEHQS